MRTKRAYDDAEPGDGYRVLIDRVWPRGVSREKAQIDEWARDLAPSPDLRKWFGHKPERFAEFRRRYREELAAHADRIDALRRRAADGPVTIVYGARDREHNNAVVLAELLRDGGARSGRPLSARRPPSATPTPAPGPPPARRASPPCPSSPRPRSRPR